MRTLEVSDETVIAHFTARAVRYDDSSRWVNDDALARLVLDLLRPQPRHKVLDVGCGTGLWSRAFKGRAGEVVGVDVTPAMYRHARPHVDFLVDAPAEDLPFKDGAFDICTVRQGLQFMDARKAVREMARVARPGGRLCLVQLCAYGSQDQDEYFEILRLRNPARRNFFVRGDLEELLADAGCVDVRVQDHVSEEDVDLWSDHGAIDDGRRESIRRLYETASEAFKSLHAVRRVGSHFVDRMLFGIALGRKA